MNKQNHAHVEYISNPIKVVEYTAKNLMKNLAMAATHFGISLGIFMVFGVLVGAAFIPVLVAGENYLWIPVVVAGLLVLPLIYALAWVGLAQKRLSLAVSEDSIITFQEMFKNDTKKVFGLMGLSILTSIAIFGGLIFLVIPGILLAIFFSYAPYIYVRENIGVIDALGKSFELVKESFAEFLGAGSIFFVYHGVSATLANIPILGLLFSIVLIPIDLFVGYLNDAVNAYRYRSIDNIKTAGLKRPKVDPMNYIMIAVLAGLIFITILLIVGLIIAVIANPEAFENTSPYLYR